jgi:MFS family permease
VGQIPASRLIQHFGAKWIFGLSILIPSVLTLFVPAASRHSFGLALFIRCIIGFFESASFPAVYHFFPIWVPIKEKTLMIPSIVSGMYMGEIIGFSIAGVLVESTIQVAGSNLGGWPSVFYCFGTLGIVWFPFFAMRAYESPAVHPKITMDEILLINEGKAFAKMPELADHPISQKQKASFSQHPAFTGDATSPMQTEQEFRRSISFSGDGGHAPVFVSEKHGSAGSSKVTRRGIWKCPLKLTRFLLFPS